MIRISNWIRSEVNDKNRPAQNGEKLRVSPLQYIRTNVNNPRALDEEYRRLRQIAGPDHVMMVYGLYEKLRLIAADNISAKRGQLLDSKGKPYTIKDIAWLYEIPAGQVQYACAVLQKADWLDSDGEIPAIPQFEPTIAKIDNLPRFPENLGKVGAFKNESENEGIKQDKSNQSQEGNYRTVDGDALKFARPVRSDSASPSVSVSVSASISEHKPAHNDSENSDSSSDSNQNCPSDKIPLSIDVQALQLQQSLYDLLQPQTQSDRTGLANFIHWIVMNCRIGKFEQQTIFTDIMRIACKCSTKSTPPRLFNWYIKKQLAYDPERMGTRLTIPKNAKGAKECRKQQPSPKSQPKRP